MSVAPPQPGRAQKSSIGCVIVAVVLAIVTLVVIAGVVVVWIGAKRFELSQKRLRMIGLAMLSFEEMYGHFPAASGSVDRSAPPHSWRVALLPFLELQDIHDKYHFDKPWNAPENQALASTTIDVYQSPLRSPRRGMTSFVVVTGEEMMFRGESARDDYRLRDGPRMNEIRDGLTNTVMVVEIANSDIPWYEPRDVKFEDLRRVSDGADPNAANVVPLQAFVGFGDGSTRIIGPETSAEDWKKMLTANGLEDFQWGED